MVWDRSRAGSNSTRQLNEPRFLPVDAKPDTRWKQRFRNFDRAYVLLRQAMERGPAALNPLEKEGVVQRFESLHREAMT